MNAGRIAEEIRKSPEQAYEYPGPIDVYTAATIAALLGVSARSVYISCGAGEHIRVSVPVTVPIRKTPMGERV